MATIDELRQEPHWSYSALNTYLNICQAQFMYRYVDQAEVERTSVCLPFGKAFHSALTAQAWECMMGGSLTRDEIVDRFEEAFKIETEATPNLIYKEGENFDTVIDLAAKMLDAALANWSDYYTQGRRPGVQDRRSRFGQASDRRIRPHRSGWAGCLYRGLENLREPLACRKSRPRSSSNRVQLRL